MLRHMKASRAICLLSVLSLVDGETAPSSYDKRCTSTFARAGFLEAVASALSVRSLNLDGGVDVSEAVGGAWNLSSNIRCYAATGGNSTTCDAGALCGEACVGRLDYDSAVRTVSTLLVHADSAATAYAGEYEASPSGSVFHDIQFTSGSFEGREVRCARMANAGGRLVIAHPSDGSSWDGSNGTDVLVWDWAGQQHSVHKIN